jgi:hypothetical protein
MSKSKKYSFVVPEHFGDAPELGSIRHVASIIGHVLRAQLDSVDRRCDWLISNDKGWVFGVIHEGNVIWHPTLASQIADDFQQKAVNPFRKGTGLNDSNIRKPLVMGDKLAEPATIRFVPREVVFNAATGPKGQRGTACRHEPADDEVVDASGFYEILGTEPRLKHGIALVVMPSHESEPNNPNREAENAAADRTPQLGFHEQFVRYREEVDGRDGTPKGESPIELPEGQTVSELVEKARRAGHRRV